MENQDVTILEKHLKYKKLYKPNTFYWGLGIENEFYLQFDKNIDFDKEKFLKNHSPERYSLDYFLIYNRDLLKEIFPKINYKGNLPLLLNSHSFSKTDIFNEPRTVYAKVRENNPKFSGKTLWEFIEENNEYLKNAYNNTLIFDGDSIELITVDYYNVTLKDVLDELELNKKNFITNIKDVFEKNKIFQEYGKIDFMNKNHPFAVMMTNKNNVCMFNNGTIHFNVTLPTSLDEYKKIRDWNKFESDHKNYIKLIQFLEPFLLTIYGESDPLSELDNRFSFCSQRNAVSRYIGIGTYNTDTMKRGKLLVDNLNNFEVCTEEYGWYRRYYEYCGYEKLDKIGYDINFNKHFNHGVEVRFFEHQVNPERLKEIGNFLIHLGDYALENEIKENPIKSEEWNDLVLDCMRYGRNTKIKTDIFNKLFNKTFIETNIVSLFYEIYNYLETKYKNTGPFSKYCLTESSLKNIEIKIKEISNEISLVKNDIEEVKNKNLETLNTNLVTQEIVKDLKQDIRKEISSISQNINNQIKVISNNVNNQVSEVSKNMNNQVVEVSNSIKKNVNEHIIKTIQAPKLVLPNPIKQNKTQITGIPVQTTKITQPLNNVVTQNVVKLAANPVNKLVLEKPKKCCNIS